MLQKQENLKNAWKKQKQKKILEKVKKRRQKIVLTFGSKIKAEKNFQNLKNVDKKKKMSQS